MSDLSKLFQDLADSCPRQPGEHVEQRLLSEFRRHHSRRTLRVHLAQAAAILMLALALSLLVMHNSRPIGNARAGDGVQDSDAAALNGFVPLPYADSGVPLGLAVVMRVQLRASDLIAFGVPVPADDARHPIRVDVLVGQDGMARGVRFIQ